MLVFAIMTICNSRTLWAIQDPLQIEKTRGSGAMPLDAVTPGVRFEKLEQQLAEITDITQLHSFKLGTLRTETAYEIAVRVVNKTSEDIRPIKATTTCNCLVGTVPDQVIKPNGSGEIILRIRTKKYDLPINHKVRIECANSSVISIGLEGVIVPEFKASSREFVVERFDDKARFEIVLVPQYDDIDLSSVEMSSTTGVLKIVSSQIASSGVTAVLAVDQCPNEHNVSDIIELRFKRKNDQNGQKTMGVFVRLKSKQTGMRPSIMVLHLDGKESDKSEVKTVSGSATILNLSKKDKPKIDDICSLELVLSGKAIPGRFLKIIEETSGTKCEFAFDINSELCDELMSSREFVPFGLRWGSVKLDGVKFFISK